MRDPIERQDAIDVLSLGKEILSRVLDDIDVVGTDREKYSWGLRLIESNIEDIKELRPAQPETYKEKLKEIADALSEKFAYMNTCLNERDIILGYLGVKRLRGIHCDTDCTNTKCESNHYHKKSPPSQPEHRVEELLPDGTLHLFTDTDLSKVNRVLVSQNNTHYGDLYYADEDPKRGIPYRQAVIDACLELLEERRKWDTAEGRAEMRGIDAVMCAIHDLPPTQPERDIPIKPIETTDKAWGIPSRQAVCPKCGYYLSHIAFLDIFKGKRFTYCENCGQAIDWEDGFLTNDLIDRKE